MFLRLMQLILVMVILDLVLAGCGTTAEQQSAALATTEAATAPPATPAVLASTTAPTTAPLPAEPAVAPTEVAAPTTVANQPAETPPTTEPAAETTEPETAVESSEVMRTFRIIPDQSEVLYEVTEEFFNRPVKFFSPIGRTQAIEGEFQLSLAGNQVQLEDNQFTVDLRTLTSDESRRDQRIRDNWLESNKFPLAEFKATTIENLREKVAEGQDVPFKVTGDMTIREITQPQTFDVIAKLESNTFTGTATTNLLMKDYGFEPPEILGMLKVTDGVTVTVRFVAREVESPP